jgi:hypothetical protein
VEVSYNIFLHRRTSASLDDTFLRLRSDPPNDGEFPANNRENVDAVGFLQEMSNFNAVMWNRVYVAKPLTIFFYPNDRFSLNLTRMS